MTFQKCLQKFQYTHMPYVFYKDNQQKILFTVIQDGLPFWKLYFYDGKKCYKIQTDLDNILGSNQYNMCQPFCQVINNKYCLSFCVQFNSVVTLYYIQTDDILDLRNKQLTEIKTNIYGGFVCSSKIVIALNSYTIEIYDNTKKNIEYDYYKKRYKSNKISLTRLSCIYGNENILLVSWANANNITDCGTFYFNLNKNIQKILLNQQNKNMYKASIDPLTDQIYYGEKIGLGFEERKIRKTTANDIHIIQRTIYYIALIFSF